MNDILFVLFKHKWKILLFALLGIGAAAAVHFTDPPIYQSQAKLLVKYVLERSGLDDVERTEKFSGTRRDISVIGSEMQILTSWDLARDAAQAVGVEKLLPADAEIKTPDAAAARIMKGLLVAPLTGTNVIEVSFRHSDPQVAQQTLEQLIRRYKEKHVELHRSGQVYDIVTEQRDSAKRELTRTEESLREEKKKAEIVSLPESVASLSAGLASTQLELYNAQTELAEQTARVQALEQLTGTASIAISEDVPKGGTPEPADVREYQMLVTQLGQLRQTEIALLTKFLPSAAAVRQTHDQITTLESKVRALEDKYPSLITTASAGEASPTGRLDLATERARLAAVTARVSALNQRLADFKKKAEEFVDVEPRIAELMRIKEVNETNYKLLAERLEKSRVDETLDPERIPNIPYVQRPSPSVRAAGERRKVAMGLAGGGIVAGLALAFLLELVLFRTVKRPLQVETRIGLPLMLSIPFAPRLRSNSMHRLGNDGNSKLATAKPGTSPGGGLSPWDPAHFIRPFAEAVRDRLVLHFELTRLTRKPKLVAVTGLSKGAGVSTLAGGLASALSETGDGKVLLVDMNVERTSIQPFFDGEAACSLIDALQPAKEMSATADNLYLATVADSATGPMQLVPKRFYDLIPHLKASHFDYIIFDMPPVSESSATLAIAGFMDKVLFVVEAEENNVDTLKRAVGELTAARADVSGIFNKGRSYAPKWLKAEL